MNIGGVLQLLRGLAVAGLLIAAGATPLRAAPDPLDHDIERLLSLPAAQDPRVVRGLEALLAQAEPPTQPKLLMFLGLMQASRSDRSAAQAYIERLQGMGTPEAKIALAVLRAAMEPHAEAAKRWLLEAQRDLSPAVGDLVRFRLLNDLSFVHEETGRLDEAVRSRLQAIETADRMGNVRRGALTRGALAWTYMNMHQLSAAHEVVGRALKQARTLNNSEVLAQTLNNQAFIEAESGRPAEGLKAMNEAIALVEQSGDRSSLALFLANAADFSLKSNDPNTAIRLSERALHMGRELADQPVIGVALANRAMAKIMLKQFESGKADLAEATKLDDELGQLHQKVSRLQEAAGYLEGAGDLPGALTLYLEHRPLADRLFKDKQQQVILELQADFERSERQRELRLLHEEAALQAASLEGEKLQERTWLAIANAATMTLGLLIWLWRQTRQANQQLAQINAQLLVQSECDPLTGLANRRRMAQIMVERHSDGRWHGCLMLIDLDHFKRINDRYGHAAGDAVLLEVSRRLTASVDAADLVVRWGGEEFLIAAHAASTEDAERLAQRVLDSLCQAPVRHEQQSIPVTASIGYACFPMGPNLLTLPWERAIDLVDTALYLAKAHGRNRAYGVHTRDITREADLLAVASSLEEAWRSGRIDLQLRQGGTAAHPNEAAA
ncbi:MAG: GGDEF domain-containing protein [Ideonella sp.]|nr:GGDEF domain-containing protein [Ideonella sp.]